MRTHQITDRLTEKRRQWLRNLVRGGPQESKTVVGFQCRKLGWTEIVFIRNGVQWGRSEIENTYGPNPGSWQRAADDGWRPTDMEQITQKGREILAAENEQ